jgi:hypothetical protein
MAFGKANQYWSVIHEVLIKSFDVPERDRCQIVREHAPSRMIFEDTGLGIK